jgi:hypothetical protein
MPPRFLTCAALAGAIGLINCLGNLGGFVGPNVREYVAREAGSQGAALRVIGLVGTAGAVLFLVALKLGIGGGSREGKEPLLVQDAANAKELVK